VGFEPVLLVRLQSIGDLGTIPEVGFLIPICCNMLGAMFKEAIATEPLEVQHRGGLAPAFWNIACR
jgi:hypothetical protein